MKKNNVLIALLLLFTGSAFAQSTVSEGFSWDGRNRDYRVHIPPAATSGDLLPLIINMHGFSGSAHQQEIYTGMDLVADTAGFFVVYPNGTQIVLFLRGWAMELDAPAVDDIGFISAMIDTLIANYPIDPAKVYACGFSNGGGMTSTLACAIPDKIRAFGMNAPSILPSNAPLCNPSIVRPMLHFHGTADAVVPYGGGPGFAPAQGFFEFWVGQDICAAPIFENLPNTDPLDMTTVSRVRFDNCNSGNKHWFYRINGGTHSWPGAADGSQDINANAELWEFFRENGASARMQPVVQKTKLTLAPNPASDYALLQGLQGEWTLEIIDYTGRVQIQQSGTETVIGLSTASLETGLYIVKVQDEQGSRTSRLLVQQ